MPLLVIWAGLPWQQIPAGAEAVPQTFVLPHVKEGENNREGMRAEGRRGRTRQKRRSTVALRDKPAHKSRTTLVKLQLLQQRGTISAES